MVADRSCLQAINEAWAAQRLPGVTWLGEPKHPEMAFGCWKYRNYDPYHDTRGMLRTTVSIPMLRCWQLFLHSTSGGISFGDCIEVQFIPLQYCEGNQNIRLAT